MCAALLLMRFAWANKPSASSSGEPCHDKWPATSHPLQCETFCYHTAWPSMILRGHPTTTTSPPSSSPTAFSSPFPKFYSVHQRRRPGREVESSSTPTSSSCPHTPTPEWQQAAVPWLQCDGPLHSKRETAQATSLEPNALQANIIETTSRGSMCTACSSHVRG